MQQDFYWFATFQMNKGLETNIEFWDYSVIVLHSEVDRAETSEEFSQLSSY